MVLIDCSNWDLEDRATRRKLEKIVKELKSKTSYDGHSTTLVSIWIPVGTPASEISQLINQELATAARIKSKTTRKHVQAALRSIASRFKAWKEIPPKGLLIYCGVTAQKNDLEYYEIIPPLPVKKKLYMCDSIFHVEVLEEMLKVYFIYGIILLERDEATIGMLHGQSIELIKHIRSYVHGKHRKGGQSQRRFERLVEEAYEYHLKKVAEEANKIFLPLLDKLRGIIIGGPGFAKEDFYNKKLLDYRLQEKVICLVSTQYLEFEGLREAIQRAMDKIKESEYVRSKMALDELMGKLARAPEYVVSGIDETLKALLSGKLAKLYLIEELTGKLVLVKCGDKFERYMLVDDIEFTFKAKVEKLCSKYGVKPEIRILSEDPLDFLLDKAYELGVEVIIIPSKGELGEQLKGTFGGVSGILRVL